MSLNKNNEAYMCVLYWIACRAYEKHTSKMKDRPQPLTHASKYPVSVSKYKIQYCASSIFSIC